METTNAGQPDNLGFRRRAGLAWPTHGRISQASVDSVGVVVVDVITQQAMQVPLIQDDHVIEKFPASTADPSLGDPILPWAPKGRSLRLDSYVLDRLRDPF